MVIGITVQAWKASLVPFFSSKILVVELWAYLLNFVIGFRHGWTSVMSFFLPVGLDYWELNCTLAIIIIRRGFVNIKCCNHGVARLTKNVFPE